MATVTQGSLITYVAAPACPKCTSTSISYQYKVPGNQESPNGVECLKLTCQHCGFYLFMNCADGS